MAMLFDLDAQRHTRFGDGGAVPIDAAFDAFSEHLLAMDPARGLKRLRRYKHKFGALENRIAAKLNEQTGSDRATKRALDDGKTSKTAIAKAAARAETAAKNPDLIDKQAAGDLSEEHLDLIADTSAKTDGAAAVDAEFIDKIADVDPDQAKNIADDFVTDHSDPNGVKTEHDRQRRLRRASKYYSKKKGLDIVGIEGDGVAIKNMWDKIQERANELYHADGGRDLATGKHPRTNEQRRFDAAYELICGITTTPLSTKNQPRHADTKGSGRPQIFVGLTLDKYLGLDPRTMAEQVGLGLIPDSVLADYLEHADILGVLYDNNGQPLWIGRSKRHATLMQRYALIARDKACVRCGAAHQQCDVHHLMPWNAPAKGETNLDELALLCGPCHRHLHATNHTLYRDHNHTWRTRPATPNETPPKPINYPQRE